MLTYVSSIHSCIKSMERNKGDMVQKAETIQQLKTRISHLELERTQIQNNVYDAEQALRTAAKDREYMGIYVKNLLASFEKVCLLDNAVNHECHHDVIGK